MRKRRTWIVLAIVLVLVVGGGYGAYALFSRSTGGSQEPVLRTAAVIRGDLVIGASGPGTLAPAEEVDLGFRTAGYLAEVLVEVGDRVQAGDVLARIETAPLEQALAQADVAARLAQLELAEIRAGPTDAELAAAEAAVRDARVELDLAQGAYEAQNYTDLNAQAVTRQYEYEWFRNRYWRLQADHEKGEAGQSSVDNAYNDMLAAEGRLRETLEAARAQEIQAQNRVDKATSSLYQAVEKLELLRSEPLTETLLQAELKVDQALLALEDARADLEAAVLRAPFDGTVMDVAALPGEQVGTGPVVTLADLAEPCVSFWVEEADFGSVAVGNPVNVVFEVLPDDTFVGQITRVEPALETVQGTLAIHAWATVDLSSKPVDLLSGMTAEIEVVAGEARNALLVPIQALRELSPGQYAVFVVDASGELELQPVEVGLMDFVYAEIVSGLESGEIVSAGEAETASSVEVPEGQMPGGGFFIPGGGPP